MKPLLPIVKVIAHTEFHAVPVDLLPAAIVQTHRNHIQNRDPLSPEWSADLQAIGLARDEVHHKGQDQGTTGERLIECAGRTCYDSYGAGRPSAEYHKHIMEVDHGSVCEHAWISFFLGNISRGLTHELVRHRVGVAISQRSTRYVDENESEWVWHPLIIAWQKENPEGVGHFSMDYLTDNVHRHANDAYGLVVQHLQSWLIAKGIDKFTARKQARGAARGLLGNALLTEMVWSVNIRTLRGTILKQRANAAADAEIRALALRLWEEALPYYPNYLGDFKRRPSPDGLADELYLPNSPLEKLREENRLLKVQLEARMP